MVSCGKSTEPRARYLKMNLRPQVIIPHLSVSNALCEPLCSGVLDCIGVMVKGVAHGWGANRFLQYPKQRNLSTLSYQTESPNIVSKVLVLAASIRAA